jgi:hypothetical protein
MNIPAIPGLSSVTPKLAGFGRKVGTYRYLIFLVFVVILYGFVLLRVNSLGSAQPSEQAVTNEVKAARLPHFNQSVINQLQSLQDNSVNVQTLFDEARNNPFQQ